MAKTFQDIESEFTDLKRQFRLKLISEREFKDRLKKLRLNDKEGRCWTIGARSGKWYYFDQDKWVESDPPTIQDGKAICIYCGYENSIEEEFCRYCGGNIGENLSKCQECGYILENSEVSCPVCNDQTEIEEKEESYSPPPFPKISRATWDNLKEWETDADESETEEEKEAPPSPSLDDIPLEHPGIPNLLIRSVDKMSLALFFGIMGMFIGLIAGIFAGTTRLWPELVDILPSFYQSMHGKITGGIIFGITGGLAGFAGSALFGFLQALFVNLVFSILGGLKVRLDKIDIP